MVSVPVATETIDGTTSQAAPVLGNRFDPAAIYAARAGRGDDLRGDRPAANRKDRLAVDETGTISPTRT